MKDEDHDQTRRTRADRLLLPFNEVSSSPCRFSPHHQSSIWIEGGLEHLLGHSKLVSYWRSLVQSPRARIPRVLLLSSLNLPSLLLPVHSRLVFNRRFGYDGETITPEDTAGSLGREDGGSRRPCSFPSLRSSPPLSSLFLESPLPSSRTFRAEHTFPFLCFRST